jgi:hypothetical protein
MRLAPDLAEACERLARCVQPLADAEGREWLVVKPYREGGADGYVPVLPWAVPLSGATALELRHAAGRVVPGFVAGEETPVNMHATPAVTVPAAGPSIRPVTPAPQTPDPGRPRSRGVEPQTGRG